MTWNWQHWNWPEFSYNQTELDRYERQFLQSFGMLLGAFKHIRDDDKSTLIVDIISEEAIKTSEIEGEHLNRYSVHSSLRRHFGLDAENRRIPLAEQGISEMMIDVYESFAAPLTHETIYRWHTMLTKGRTDLEDIGRYRTCLDAMQVVSGPLHRPIVHFEAPPSHQVMQETDRFITWFEDTAPDGRNPLPALTRAGIAHLYFVCIHPLEDGNGRIGRAIAEKSLAQSFGQPTLLALSHIIQKHKKAYYDALEHNNTAIEITDWLVYFSETILQAQARTQSMIDFVIEKIKLYDKVRGQLNERQDKLLMRMFREGPEGFTGGLSVRNYLVITGASRATATRDLQDLVEKNILTRTGELKGTRYHLNIALIRKDKPFAGENTRQGQLCVSPINLMFLLSFYHSPPACF